VNSSRQRHIFHLGGRLGNLLFEVAFAVAKSAATGSGWAVTGSLDPETKRSLEAWVGPLCWAEPNELILLRGKSGSLGALYRWGQKFLPAQYKRWVTQTKAQFEAWHTAVKGPAYWAGYWQSYHYFADHAKSVRESLRFRSTLRPSMVEFLSIAEQPESVSVHVRRGDYLATKGFFSLDPQYYRKALELLSATGPVLVFTDDPEWCRRELDLGTRFRLVEGGLAEEDLYLMSRCQHHVVAHSTYSWWGAWLGDRQGGRTIAPAIWFATFGRVPPLTDIYPAEWEVILP